MYIMIRCKEQDLRDYFHIQHMLLIYKQVIFNV